MKTQIKNEKELLKQITNGLLPMIKIAKQNHIAYRTLWEICYREPKFIKALAIRRKKQGK